MGGLRWVAELQGGQEPQLVAGCRPEHITRLRPPPRDLVHHLPVRLRDRPPSALSTRVRKPLSSSPPLSPFSALVNTEEQTPSARLDHAKQEDRAVRERLTRVPKLEHKEFSVNAS